MTKTTAKQNVMTRAWEIRKEAAKKFSCKVIEINFSACLKLAWREFVKMIIVESSAITSIGYDRFKKEIHVIFKSGDTAYIYNNAPTRLFNKFIGSKSIGKFLHKRLRGRDHYRAVC